MDSKCYTFLSIMKVKNSHDMDMSAHKGDPR